MLLPALDVLAVAGANPGDAAGAFEALILRRRSLVAAVVAAIVGVEDPYCCLAAFTNARLELGVELGRAPLLVLRLPPPLGFRPG